MFKSEKDYLIAGTDGVRINIVDTYILLFKIIKLSNIKILAMILLTIKVNEIRNCKYIHLLHPFIKGPNVEKYP